MLGLQEEDHGESFLHNMILKQDKSRSQVWHSRGIFSSAAAHPQRSNSAKMDTENLQKGKPCLQ